MGSLLKRSQKRKAETGVPNAKRQKAAPAPAPHSTPRAELVVVVPAAAAAAAAPRTGEHLVAAAIARFNAGAEVVVIPLPAAERAQLRARIQASWDAGEILHWMNERLLNEASQMPLNQIELAHILGEKPWPAKLQLKFPNFQSGMLNTYFSKIHEAALQLSTVQALLAHKFPDGRWVLDPNRLRLAQPGTGGSESTHFDHSGLNPQRVGRPAMILSLSVGRTFSWYRRTSQPEEMARIRDHYKVATKMREGKNYVTLPLDPTKAATRTNDPLGLLAQRTRVALDFGDIAIFNDNLLHEIAKNDSKSAQFSIFLSPRHTDAMPCGGAINNADAMRRRTASQKALSHLPDNITIAEANKLSFLLGVAPPFWPSAKPTWMAHQQAVKAWRSRFRATALTPGKNMPFDPLPPQTVAIAPLQAANKLAELDGLPAAAFTQRTHWHRDPTALPVALQFHLGFRSQLP